MARARLKPRADRTVHFITDPHFGAIATARSAKALADIGHSTVPVPVCHVVGGDIIENGLASEDTTALAWLNQLPAPYHVACGNHDVYLNARTVAAWEAAYGVARNRTVDLGFIQLVFVAPDSDTRTLTQATLDWLDATLAAATKNCWGVCHYPLANTHVGDTGGATPQWSSAEANFQIGPDADLRAIANARTRLKAWLSGHTHTEPSVSGVNFTKLENVGTRTIACVNGSSLYYTGRSASVFDPIRSFYLTDVGTGVEIRPRNHGAASWGSIGADRVTTLAYA